MRDTVVLGGASCSLVQYEVSVRLVCRTAAVSRQQRVSVLVGNAAGYSEAAQRFSFKVSGPRAASPARRRQRCLLGARAVLSGRI